MKRLFLLLISLVLAGNFLMIAQDKKVVAVIARGKGLPVEVSLSPVVDKFVDALRQSTENNYQVVDRSDDFMQFVDFELRYQASGLVDDTQLATIGKRLGADLVCGVLVERSYLDSDYYFRARLIEVENTDIVGDAYYPDEISGERKVTNLQRMELQRVSLYLTKKLDFMSDIQRVKWQRIIDNYEKGKNGAKVRSDLTALGASIIPGVGLIMKGHTGEGVGYLIGDLVFVGGGAGMLAYANKQKSIMEDRTTDYESYNTAVEGYDFGRTVGSVCFFCAGAVYICNLIRAYTARPKRNSTLYYEPVGMSVYTPQGFQPGVGFSLAYHF